MSQGSNFLLLIIIAILLFGSGAVLGFFSILFWIIAGILLIVFLIFIFVGIVVDQKEAFQKHPIAVTIMGAVAVIFFFWLGIAWLNQESRKNIMNAKYTADVLPTQSEEIQKYKHFNLEKARQIAGQQGLSEEDIHAYLQSHPDVHVYPEVNRDAFLTNCNKESNNLTNYCYCLLTYFEARYTFDEFIQIESDYVKANTSEELTRGIQYCAQE